MRLFAKASDFYAQKTAEKAWCKIGKKIAETIETVISFFLVYCLNVIFTFFLTIL
jgi:steroid 5-alpha reductase family enzyme